MVIGGALGGAVGLVFQAWMPSVVTRIDVFVILGMAAFFSAAAKRQRGLLPLTLPRRPCILPRAGVFKHT
jgi:H+/Cl- antiporter ClcA